MHEAGWKRITPDHRFCPPPTPIRQRGPQHARTAKQPPPLFGVGIVVLIVVIVVIVVVNVVVNFVVVVVVVVFACVFCLLVCFLFQRVLPLR